MNRYVPVGVGIVAAIIAITLALQNAPIQEPENIPQRYSYDADFNDYVGEYFSKSSGGWTFVNSTSIFNTYVKEDEHVLVDGKKHYNQILLELDPKINYEGASVKNEPKKSVVIFPTFTASAYTEPGFYTYYRNECGSECLTTQIRHDFLPQANPNAVQTLYLLGYSFVTDVDVDKDPSILSNYDKVIVLHNEYVTKREFDAITKHPSVIYLYPNALYAEVEANYDKNTITLVRGHNYPSAEIRNGFDWEFDNSVLEYNVDCKDMEFYRINNGWMLNCYPENIIHKSLNFLKIIKQLE
ncbi:hypothetical protein [Candidatus Nitrosotenuis cloacae]|uniref:hypothetical protein n=1 Tax=Candidatus Nitrosotenuis cloacae TaxID=1603555 RepID=UPI00227FF171|nr:hypothetical protein [Candidatus Nitrosotenuis cloacae]